MELYCKYFDEDKCRYDDDTNELCLFYSCKEDDIHSSRYSIHVTEICGKELRKIEYVTKFEYLMLKELEER